MSVPRGAHVPALHHGAASEQARLLELEARALADRIAKMRAMGLFVRAQFAADEARLDVWLPAGSIDAADRAASTVLLSGRIWASRAARDYDPD